MQELTWHYREFVPQHMGFLQAWQFGPGFNSMSPASRRSGKTASGKMSLLSEKTAMDFFSWSGPEGRA